MSSSSDIIQRQLDAYNSQDIEAFLACYAEDALLSGLNGDVTQSGRDVRRRGYLHDPQRPDRSC